MLLLKSILSVSLISLLADVSSVSAENQPNTNCAGGVKNGEIVDLKRYWYECQNGQLIPKGCWSEEPDHRRINIGDTYDSNGYRMQCIKDGDGYLTFRFKSCVYNGREYQAGEVWDDAKYSYTCSKEGDHLRVEVAGCLDEGRRVDINQKVTKGSFVYQCLKTKNGTCSMCPVGCVKDGREYGIDEAFDRQDYWYTCIRDGKKLSIKPSGCVNGGRRYQDGEHFNKADVVYQCYAREGEAKTNVVGCVQRENGANTERRLGDNWMEGRSPYKYEMTCKERERDNSAVVVQERCNYDVSKGKFFIEPGCYKIVDQSAVGCLKDNADRLELRAFRVQDIEQATSLGLRFC